MRGRPARRKVTEVGQQHYLSTIGCLLGYIYRILEHEEISEYKFCKDNNLSCSYVHNLRRLLTGSPTAFRIKLSFDIVYYLSLKYGIPFLASDYLDTSANYPDNYLPKKSESKPNKLAKKTTKTPPKPKFI